MTVPRQRPTQRNVHHLRELTFLEEQYGQVWATDLKDLLREMKAATDQARSSGARRQPVPDRDRFVARYEEMLATGLAANPPPVHNGLATDPIGVRRFRSGQQPAVAQPHSMVFQVVRPSYG